VEHCDLHLVIFMSVLSMEEMLTSVEPIHWVFSAIISRKQPVLVLDCGCRVCRPRRGARIIRWWVLQGGDDEWG
jgi:hypothetical protein